MIECPWCKSTVLNDQPNCAYCRKPLDGTPPPAPVAEAPPASSGSTGRWRMEADMGADPVGSVLLNPHDDAAWSATNTAARAEVVREVTWQRPEVPELELDIEAPPPRKQRRVTAELGTPAKLPTVPEMEEERSTRNRAARLTEEEAFARAREREQGRAEARQAKIDALSAHLPPEVAGVDQKNGWAIMSACVPGLGQMMKGDERKGYGAILAIFVAYLMNWMPVVTAIWIWNVYDAYTAPKPRPPLGK